MSDWDPEEYEFEQARRMRARRLANEDYDRKLRETLAAERAKPIEQRQYFSWADVAERLARDPRSLAPDPRLRERIVQDLGEWVQNGQLAPGEVVTLSGNRPDFRPLELTPGAVLVPDPEVLFLSREAGQRYTEARVELPGAERLLDEWFSEVDRSTIGESAAREAGSGATTSAPGGGNKPIAHASEVEASLQPSRPETIEMKQRRSRNPKVEELISEGAELVKKGKETMHSAGKIIAEREWQKDENLLAPNKIAQSKEALAQQIRKGIAQILRSVPNI
jgi:hypothetical protein